MELPGRSEVEAECREADKGMSLRALLYVCL